MSEEELDDFEEYESVTENVHRAKMKDPGMFVSAWEQDENDIDAWSKKEIKADPLKQFIVAAEENNIEFLREVLGHEEFNGLKRTEYLDSKDPDGYTALHRATYQGNYEVVNLLLDNGADLNCRTNDDWTPLHSAAFWNQTACVQLLVESGADYKSRTLSNQTPLHLAASNNQTMETIAYLISLPDIEDIIFEKNMLGDSFEDLIKKNTPHSYIVDAFDKELIEI